MAKTDKITNAQVLIAVRDYIAENHMADGEEFQGFPSNILVEKLNTMLTSLEKKKTSAKVTAKKTENEGIKSVIYDVLVSSAKPLSISEITTASADLSALSNQKISSLLTQMKEEKRVVRTEVKGKAYYGLTADEVDG
jgi:hypothetical protein